MAKESTTHKTFEVEGRFSITVPIGWENSRCEDVLLLLINPSIDGSGVFVDFTEVDWSTRGAKKRLVEAGESFLNDAIIPNEHRAPVDVVSMTFGNDEAHSIRTFAAFEGAHVWVVQFSFCVESRIVFILHWNGPESLAKSTICPIFDSFEIAG